MSYRPYRGHDPYPSDDYGQAPRRGDRGDGLAAVIRVVVGLVVSIFALHVLFVVLHANSDNGFVETIYTLAQTFVLGLGDVFTPRDALIGVVLNYLLAALVYLVVGHLVARAVQRR